MSNATLLTTSVEALASAPVLCVGDVILDRFVYGDVNRISPEAPIPVFATERETVMLGGAGNVVRNMAGLGAEAYFITVAGEDGPAQKISYLLDELTGVRAEVIHDQGRKTSIKTRYIAGGQQMMRADDETVEPLGADIRNQILTWADPILDNCGAVVLADYGKGVLMGEMVQQLIALAEKAGVKVIIDPQGADYSGYRGAHLITPNRKELATASGMATGTDEEITTACRSLIDSHGLHGVLATKSGDGMTLVEADSFRHFDAEAREVFDVSGAGDTVAATLAVGLAAGVDRDQAVQLANIAAGIVVGKLGTAVAYKADIINELHHQEFASGEEKILSLEAALDRVLLWRNQGLQIGFTNGCFDLLHPGHISTVAKAKAACDRLILGLNSDESVKRLKGKDRPIQSEIARAQVLASLENIDLLVIFGEDTPANIIKTLKPEVLVKGADYKVEDIPEAAIVRAYGGKIHLAKLEKGHSTTATIAKMAK